MLRGKLIRHLLGIVVIYLIFTGTINGEDATNAGSISGTVTYKSKAQASQKLKVDKDVEVCAIHAKYSEEVVVSTQGGLMNVVVQVIGAKGEVIIQKGANRPSLYQKECQFSPHVQVIPAGTRMNIYNEDGLAHNIHTLSVDNPSFNQQQPGLKKRMVTKKNDFTKPEKIPLKCDIHNWMKAWIVVVDHPYYAVTSDLGSFKISGIPAGTYDLEFWHETLGKQTQKVTVKAGADTAVNIVFEPEKN